MSENIKEDIDGLLEKINENKMVILPQVMELFLIEIAKSDYSDIKIEDVAEKFEEIRNCHERERDKFLRDLKKAALQQMNL